MKRKLLLLLGLVFGVGSALLVNNEIQRSNAQEVSVGRLAYGNFSYDNDDYFGGVSHGVEVHSTNNTRMYFEITNRKPLNVGSGQFEDFSNVYFNVYLYSTDYDEGYFYSFDVMNYDLSRQLNYKEFFSANSINIRLSRYQSTQAFAIFYEINYRLESGGNRTVGDSQIRLLSNPNGFLNSSNVALQSFDVAFSGSIYTDLGLSYSNVILENDKQHIYDNGFDDGFDEGYKQGINDTELSGTVIGNVIFSTIGSIASFVVTIASFEVLGISIGSLVSFVVSVGLILIILKMVGVK